MDNHLGAALGGGVRKPFYEKAYYAYEKAIGLSTEEKALWFADYISPQIGPYKTREAEVSLLSDEVRSKRNSRKCHFFSDLAALVTPSLEAIIAAHQQRDPSYGKYNDADIVKSLHELYRYDSENFFALLKRGPIHSFNVLALKMDDIDHWEGVIRTMLPGWQDYRICRGRSSSSSEQFQYKQVKNILSNALRPESNTAMRSCDTFQIFYPERI